MKLNLSYGRTNLQAPLNINCQGDDPFDSEDPASDSGILEKPQVTEPSFFKVLLHNDDFTPMEFVTQILKKFFHKTSEEAEKIMMQVHKNGHGVAGVFPFEVAETKVFMTNNYAKQNKFPLKCSMEED